MEQPTASYDTWVDRPAFDADGDRLGDIHTIYYDDVSGRPEWVAVKTGRIFGRMRLVPIAGSRFSDDGLTLAYTKDKIENAPDYDIDGHLDPDQERDLYSYYGFQWDETTSDWQAGTWGYGESYTTADRADRDYEYDRTAWDHDATDDAMTRSEEELRVGTETTEAGRARLRKYVVTEHQAVQVPVSREEVRVEREPISGTTSGGTITGDEEAEVVLQEERPVVSKETVAKERVRLEKDTVTDTETVEADVRKERIDVEGADNA